jgi:hypothetical protein
VSNFDELLSALAGVPVLPGARCRGRHALFDPQRPDEADEVAQARHSQAVGLCEHCPALAACQLWVNSLPPPKRPSGVIAGQLRRERPRRARPNDSPTVSNLTQGQI